MKKILIVVSALVAVMLCSCKKDDGGQTTKEYAYSVKYVASSFSAMVGHSGDIETFGNELKAAVGEKYDSDTAAVAAVDLLFAKWNHQYISGNFTLCKGPKGGAVEDLQNYELKMMKYSVKGVLEVPYGYDSDDSVAFVVELDTAAVAPICAGVITDEAKMVEAIKKVNDKWSKKAKENGGINIMANYFLLRDSDTLGKFVLRAGKDKCNYSVDGYDNLVIGTDKKDTTECDNLKKAMAAASKKFTEEGYSSYDVNDSTWKIASGYQGKKLGGYLFVWRGEKDKGNALAAKKVKGKEKDDRFVRYIAIHENPDNPHNCYVSFSGNLKEDFPVTIDAEHSKYDPDMHYGRPWKFGNDVTDINKEYAWIYAFEVSKWNKAQDGNEDEVSNRYNGYWSSLKNQFNSRTLRGTFYLKVSDKSESTSYDEKIEIYPYLSDLVFEADTATSTSYNKASYNKFKEAADSLEKWFYQNLLNGKAWNGDGDELTSIRYFDCDSFSSYLENYYATTEGTSFAQFVSAHKQQKWKKTQIRFTIKGTVCAIDDSKPAPKKGTEEYNAGLWTSTY